MELVKKNIILKTVEQAVSGGTIIVPDTTINYRFKILLKSNDSDFGMFDAYEDENSTAIGIPIPSTTFTKKLI